MKRNIRQKLILLSFITLSAVGLIGFADYKTNQKLVSSGQWVQQTERVIYQSDNLYALCKDIEIHTQACLISTLYIFKYLNFSYQTVELAILKNITIEAKTAGLQIELKDDGAGFDLTRKRRGIGLSNMMNRIESFNGQMILESSVGEGCSIRIDIPFG